MKLIRILLRLYPRAWRVCYQEEMLAALEQHTITSATFFDLLLGAINAHLDPNYRSQKSLFSFQNTRFTAISFVVLLTIFTTTLFIWQTLSMPYMRIINVQLFVMGKLQGVTPTPAPPPFNTFGLDNPSFISNNFAVYTLYIEYGLLLIANLFFVVRILKNAPSTRRKPLLIAAFTSFLLPLLALPFLASSSIVSLIPTTLMFVNPASVISLLCSTIMVLEIVGSGLFIGLIQGWKAIRERRKALLAMAAAVVLLPTLGFFISRFFMGNIVLGFVEYPYSSLPSLQEVLYNFAASLLPFLGFGTLLLAVGIDELQGSAFRRALHYASALTATLIVSLLATITWNVTSWLQFYGKDNILHAFAFHLSPQRVFFGGYGLLLCILFSLFTWTLLRGIRVMLRRGYSALSLPPAQGND